MSNVGYFANNGCTHPQFPGTKPAFYDSVQQKTWVFWEAWATQGVPAPRREVRCLVFNHVTGRPSAEYVVATNCLTNDAHGGPGARMDPATGHVYVFYGAHADPMHVARTATPRNPAAWVALADLGATLTYSKPIFTQDGKMHWTGRNFNNGNPDAAVAYTTTSLTNGVPVWRPERELVDFGANSRAFHYDQIAVGNDIHLCVHISAFGDDERRHVYYCIYTPSTGIVRNIQNTFSKDVHANGGVTLAQMNANCRVYNSGLNLTSPMTFQLDSQRRPHIAFCHGPTKNLRPHYTGWDGSQWLTPAPFANAGRGDFNLMAMVAKGSDRFEIYFVDDTDNPTPTSSGKTIRRRKFSGTVAGGITWQDEEIIHTWDGTKKVGFPHEVFQGHANARVVYSENVIDDTIENGTLKLFLYGDGGLLRIIRDTWNYANAEAAAYVARLAVKPTYDEAYRIDELFRVLKTIGLAKFDFFHFNGYKNRADARKNLISPNHSWVEHGGTTWRAGRGFKGNGTNAYLECGFNPATAGGAMRRDSAHVGIWTLIAGNTNVVMGARDGTRIANLQLTDGGVINFRMNDNTATSYAVPNKIGHHVTARNAGNKHAERNGANLGTTAVPSTGLPNSQMRMFSQSLSTWSNQEVLFDHCGADLTTTENASLYNMGLKPLARILGVST